MTTRPSPPNHLRPLTVLLYCNSGPVGGAMTLGWQRPRPVPVALVFFFFFALLCWLLCSSVFQCGLCEVVVCVWRGRAYWTSLVAFCPVFVRVARLFSRCFRTPGYW